MGGNNMSKNEVQCTLTTAERKKNDNLKYLEVLRPNLIKTSSRKKNISKAIEMNLLNYEEYRIKKRLVIKKHF